MHRSLSVLASVACAVAVSSCAALDVNNLPQPGNNYGDGYEIVLEFDNVLNLPDRAKVVKDGTTVGVVEEALLGKNAVDVTVRIDRSVRVPADVRAVLQQATVLGDIYVALDSPAAAAGSEPALAPGSRVPIAQTTSPPQLEETLANLANFVGSGSIQRIQSTIIGINRVTPERADQIRALASRVSRDLADLSANIDTADLWLDGVAQTASVLSSRAPQFQRWTSPGGMLAAKRIFYAATYLVYILRTCRPN